MTIEVSVLVPIYNVSQYIERCAHSLFKQTFKDLEFIFVNDASTDNSIELLENVIKKYPELKNCIRIIQHDSNKGLAEVRNTALNASKGKYISVVDSDDYVEPKMIETLYKKAIEMDADIVVSDFYMDYSTESILRKDFLSSTPENHFPDMIKNEDSQSYLWNKLIKRSLYMKVDCQVPSGLNYLEDRHVMIRLYFYAQKIVKVNQAFYHYIQYNQNSITRRITSMNFENVIYFWTLFDEFLIRNNIYERYELLTQYQKVQNKVRLMLDCSSSKLISKYANIYIEEELKYIDKFRFGERLIMYQIRNHNFIFALFLQKLLVIKNCMTFKNGKIIFDKGLIKRILKFD